MFKNLENSSITGQFMDMMLWAKDILSLTSYYVLSNQSATISFFVSNAAKNIVKQAYKAYNSITF